MSDGIVDTTATVVAPPSKPGTVRKRPPRRRAPVKKRATQLEVQTALELTNLWASLQPADKKTTIQEIGKDGKPVDKKIPYQHKKAILYTFGYILKMVQGII